MINKYISTQSLLFILLFFLSFNPLQSHAQTQYTLSGYIKDLQTGETLIGANVYNSDNKVEGTSANLYGFYSLTLPEGVYKIEASFLGYSTQQIEIELNKNITFDFKMIEDGIMLEDIIEVTAKRKDQNVESTDMGRVDLSIESIKSLPALLGEVDVLRAIQLLPGVMSSGEINSGLYVRGGGPDQNLILLDEAVVYNTGHLFGFFSVFNPDAIKNTTLHKGSMPAEFGGRLSSVLELAMKEGNNQEWKASGGIGLISSRLTVEGPLVKNKSSILISGRRTYADVLAQPFLKGGDFEGNGYFFYDLNTKINYQFSDKDRIFASGYFGRDVLNYRSTDGLVVDMPWGNATATMRWNHLFSNKLFLNVSAIYNSYNFGIQTEFNNFQSSLYSGINDYNFKLDFDYFPNPKHTIKYGANYTYHTFTPYTVDAQVGETEIDTDTLTQQYAHEAAVYFQDEFSIGKKLKVNAGIRASAFRQVGPYQSIVQTGISQTERDTIQYARGEPIETYFGIAPRLSLRYTIDEQTSLKASYVFSNQYIHLVSNATSTLPTDLWVPSTARVKPQRGEQFSLGLFRNFADNEYEASIEGYYRNMDNQIEFSENYVPALNTNIEDQFVFGSGRSYGLELFLKKRKGRFNGWIGYTLSRTTRKFPDINNGNPFPARYDRTHDLSLVGSYELSDRWQLSGTFVYGTGQALTIPNSFYVIEGWVYSSFDSPRNSYRLKPYHRFDIAATRDLRSPEKKKAKPNFESELVFAIYNIYSRQNPFFVYAAPEINEETGGTGIANGSVDIKLKQVSIFPIIPSVTWNFKF
ncbi:MAG: TonB-dependent receptor [Chitinophagales bacterium]